MTEVIPNPLRLTYAGGEHIGQPGCKTCCGTGMSWIPGFENSVSQSCPRCFPPHGKPNWINRNSKPIEEGLFAPEDPTR